MSATSTALLLAAIGLAVLNWIAVAREIRALEYFSKPGATAALIAVAATLDIAHDAPWGWRIAALVFCLLGDVFLMLPRDAFVPGLASFAVAQVLFTVSFATGDTGGTRWLIGLFISVPIAIWLARRFVSAIRRAGMNELVLPVCIYMSVITAMAIGSIASGSAVAIAGAVTFMASDSLIAESRFVQERPWHGVAIMVTYHLALAGLVLGML